MTAEGIEVRVDHDRCASTGTCAASCPEVFTMLDSGAVQVASPAPASLRAEVDEAADMCPTGAITVAAQ
jgi:ferredoxin